MRRCPSCQREYADTVATCPACSVALIDPALQTRFLGSMLRFVQPYSGREIHLQPGEWIIGRADGDYMPDIDLTPFVTGPVRGISRKHAKLIVQGNGAFLQDLQSTNGILLNDKLMVPNTLVSLGEGDSITFGNATFIYRAS